MLLCLWMTFFKTTAKANVWWCTRWEPCCYIATYSAWESPNMVAFTRIWQDNGQIKTNLTPCKRHLKISCTIIACAIVLANSFLPLFCPECRTLLLSKWSYSDVGGLYFNITCSCFQTCLGHYTWSHSACGYLVFIVQECRQCIKLHIANQTFFFFIHIEMPGYCIPELGLNTCRKNSGVLH